MNKEFKIIVANCFACPNFRRLSEKDVSVDWCKAVHQELPRHRGPVSFLGRIPPWCPLPNIVDQRDK